MLHKFDLVDRTEVFGEMAIIFAKTIQKNCITIPLISQFIRSATSIGANYCEANNAESKKDFVHKVGISKKEAKETVFWIKMIVAAEPGLGEKVKNIIQEASELNLILSAIVKKSTV